MSPRAEGCVADDPPHGRRAVVNRLRRAGPVLVDGSLTILHASGEGKSSHGLAKSNTHHPFLSGA